MLIKEFIGNTEVDMKNRTVVSVIATNGLDRDNEVVLPSGINIKDFMKNPIVLYQHEQTVPIGKCVEMSVEEGNITAKTFFAARPKNHEGEWFPDTILSLFDQGILRGFSIGFQADPKHIRCSKKDKATWPGVNKVYARTLLTEYSVVSVPANGEALAKSFKSFVTEASVVEEKTEEPQEKVLKQVEATDATKKMFTDLLKTMANMNEKLVRLEEKDAKELKKRGLTNGLLAAAKTNPDIASVLVEFVEKFCLEKQQEKDEDLLEDFDEYDEETADENGAALYDQLLADEAAWNKEETPPAIKKKSVSINITQDDLRDPIKTPVLDVNKGLIAKKLGKIYA